jgi:hypothetical protein
LPLIKIISGSQIDAGLIRTTHQSPVINVLDPCDHRRLTGFPSGRKKVNKY